MGDLSVGNRLDAVRAVWVARTPEEPEYAKTRIVHQRVVRLTGLARLERLGLRRAPGYHKCGSGVDDDWITAFRVLGRRKGSWVALLEARELKRPLNGEWTWFDLGETEVDGVIIELRGCGIDRGWTPWNLAVGALSLEGERLTDLVPREERKLKVVGCDFGRLPAGVTAYRTDGVVRYRTRDYEVGFRLDRPGLSWLSLGLETEAGLAQNLLWTSPIAFHQGPQWHPVGVGAVIAPTVRCVIEGTVEVAGAEVIYEVIAAEQRYRFHWRVDDDGLHLEVERNASTAAEAWHAAAWRIAFKNSVSPTHAIGSLRREGETGGLAGPVWLNAPGFGTWQITSPDTAAGLRCESWRKEDRNILDFSVGQTSGEEGTYRLPAGRHVARFELRPVRPPERLHEKAPAVVKRALARTFFTAPTFRADIGCLSNSGVSMPCPICLDTWSAVLPRMGAWSAGPGGDPMDLLRLTVERWLQEGPGYAAGRLLHHGRLGEADDEYLMTGAAALRGIGDYLCEAAGAAWFAEHETVIRTKIAAARGRDLDGDGLIESPLRTGVSGTGQWSTCWLDVTSFGWKDAWANAILHGALRQLAGGFRRFGATAMADDLEDWRIRLHANYRPAFWNETSGWLAGWRCQENRLHDYAFLPVNGCAVHEGLLEPDEGRVVMERLLAEAKRVKLPDPALGLPINLWNIPDEDRADIMHGYPFGYYQNGGRTHSQARHTIMALYAVGMKAEADAWLERLCVGFAEARVFGGNQSGVDWRDWDDRPCGYEGLLTDQFGLLEPILYRWGSAGKFL